MTTMRYLLLLMIFGLAGCAGQPPRYEPPASTTGGSTGTPESSGATAAAGSAAAVQELVTSSRTSAANGDYALALADIERAIRIEPRNPDLWLELGELHLSQGDSRQAAAMARKAMSVAGDDRTAKAAAERLLEQASGN
jgi:Tfp pilus assembly protein PilF